MCILMNDDDDHHNSATTSLDNSSKRDGRKRWQFHTHHSWIIPKRPLLLVLAMALFMLVMGMLFMAIGAGISSVGLRVVGGLLFGFGLIGLIICFVITVHAYFFYGTRDQSTQTTDAPWTDEMTLDAAGYSSVGRPSALKSPDSTLKRNGTLGVKKVTLAPELGDYGVLPLNNSVNNNNSNNMSNNNNNHNTNNVIGGGTVGGVGSGGKANTINIVSNQQPLHRLPSTGSGNTSRANSMPRSGYVDGSTVGTGGIKITPLDPNSSQPSPASSISYGGSASQYYSTGGGGSTISGGSVNDTYAYPRSVQLSFDSGNSGSHYSTLRSIPVTHLGSGQKPSTSSYREVEYATVNKSGGLNKPVNTSVHVEHVPASQHQQQQQFQQHGGNSVSSQSQGLVTHVQMGQDKVGGASQRLVQGEDDRYKDYDNTPEPTPIIVTSVSPHPQIHQQHQQQQHQQQAHGGNATYHEQQMQFQRHQRNHSQSQNQQQQDLHAPRQVNAYSHHRQYAPNPFTFQQQSQQQQQQEQQVQQYKMHYEQEKKQQQQQIQSQQSKSSAASSARNSMVDDVFEPQPLVYPSARRPMTFDKVTSSKMSVYDNVLANNLKESDEVEASG